MAKLIKSSQVEMPLHMGSFPKTMPIFSVNHPFLGNEDPRKSWEKRLNNLISVFRIKGQISDAGDRLVLQDEANVRVLQLYKPNDAFLYYDRSLVSTTDKRYAKSVLSPETAEDRAQRWLGKNGLWSEHARYEGFAQTKVTVFNDEKGYNAQSNEEKQSYTTEVKACFGFQINEAPVLGAGGKIMISYVGEEMSQAVHFWRPPNPRSIGEQHLVSPDDIRKQLAVDPRFAHLDSAVSKIRITELKLGYYALPPFELQNFYLPVYQVKGIVETRVRPNGPSPVKDPKKNDPIVRETLQYNFNYYIHAGKMTEREYKNSGLPAPINGSFFF